MHFLPAETERTDLNFSTCLLQEIPRMSSIFRFPQLFSQSLFRRAASFAVPAVALMAVLTASTHLSAQQPETDNSSSATLVASATADPAPDSAEQAPTPAQQSSASNGSASQNQSPQSTQGDSNGQQTKRILGIVPNFRAVSADEKLPPETVKDKFVSATEDSFDYSSIFFPAVIALYNMHERTTPQFHEGAAGYGRYFWHSAVDQTSENYMVEFIVPTITHEDSRYYTLGHGGFMKRTGYALSRAVVTRSNSGSEVFNASEVFGAGASAGISNLYYPSASRSVGNTMSQWVEDVGIDAGTFWFREFWPDINRHVFHNKYGQQ
jgi:hypothetical protein